jgi:sterol desaturase/sphingolipid hydroxylase (fatty acid hydroxylase superfamily)
MNTDFDFHSLYENLEAFLPIYVFSVLALEFGFNLYFARNIKWKEFRINLLSGGVVLATQTFVQSFMFIEVFPRVYELRLFHISRPLRGLGLGVFMYSLIQYFTHFINHKIRFLWCFHEVHHSSTQMNGTAGVRNSIFKFLKVDWLYLLIPLMGVQPIIYFVVFIVAKMWGTLIHLNERVLSRIPLLNWILVDPENHHIHHAMNAVYVDKNYSEVTPILDKIFGTYAPKTEEPVFGSSSHPNPASFWDVHFYEFKKLNADLKASPDLKTKLQYCLKPPGWRPL